MKKFLLTAGLVLPFLFIASQASAQSYRYDCLCLFSNPSGTCVEYTCDAYQHPNYYGFSNYRNGCGSSNAGYYGYNGGCPSVYSNYSNYSNYRPYYRTTDSSYYDSRYNADWYGRRYTGNTGYYYGNDGRPSYYNTPYYY